TLVGETVPSTVIIRCAVRCGADVCVSSGPRSACPMSCFAFASDARTQIRRAPDCHQPVLIVGHADINNTDRTPDFDYSADGAQLGPAREAQIVDPKVDGRDA